MKRLYIAIFALSAILLGVAGKSTKGVFAPDRLFLIEGKMFVANRAANQLARLSADGKYIEEKVKLHSAVTDLVQTPDGDLWVACEGNMGWLYKLDKERLSVEKKIESGATPSAILYNSKSNSLWVAQRYGNELWEVDATTGEKKAVVEVGREPVDMISFEDDNLLLVANNLPEMASTEEHVAAQLDVVDVVAHKVQSRILLPNGATDVKSIAKDMTGEYAYVTHLLARYQLPTTQLDRGWMSTNALSIIDLEAKECLTTVLLDTPQKGAANPWEVCVTPDNREIIVAAAGSQEVVVISRQGLHAKLAQAVNGRATPSMGDWNNIPNDAGFLYGIRDFIPTGGKGVRSVVATEDKIYAANYYTAEITAISRKDRSKQNTSLGTSLSATAVGRGDMHFHDATLCYQTWQSCATCHPNDGRMDGLNWDLLNDGMGNPKNSKTLLLSHKTAPCMISGIRADAETAVRSGVKYILFSGYNEASVFSDMDEYLKAQKPIASPYLVNNKLSPKAAEGKKIYEHYNCASCHSGAYHTDQKSHRIGKDVEFEQGWDTPALIEVWRTAPYLFDGRAATMFDVFYEHHHGIHDDISREDAEALAEYVNSL